MIISGLDLLLHERLALVRSARVGLISHPAAVLPDCTAALDALRGAGVRVVALFGMEHGFSAAAADGAPVEDGFDPHSGLPVYSLYGDVREPAAYMLSDIDILIYDVQDVGARFYTFISTLYYVLRASSLARRPLIVLDRPNPVTGMHVEGPGVEAGYESFIGITSLPIRYGLTCGELARYLNAQLAVAADLTVIPMLGWRRSLWFNQCGLPWVPTSPAIPHTSTAEVYPGTCLIEGTNLSEGRGTALPFEVVGAPWLDAHALAATLNAPGLDGVRFRPTTFQPASSKHAGQLCHGVQLHVLHRESFRPVETGLRVVAACRAQDPERFAFLPTSWEGHPPHFDLLAGGPRLRQQLAAGCSLDDEIAGWAQSEAAFARLTQPFLLYES